jgi:UDP-N-acetylmuramoyl-tripeptide--D-alanyl-D-alanine ligase
VRHLGVEGSSFEVVSGDRSGWALLPLLGEHNVYNALAAVAVGLECGISLEKSLAALATVAPADKRGQVLDLGGATVIDDCYNSNPKALEFMVDALAAMPMAGSAGRRIVVAGEMLELGEASDEMHGACGRHMAKRRLDLLVGVRGAARKMVEAAREAEMEAMFLDTPEQAGEWLASHARSGDLVLLKASRGVRLERALEVWKEALKAAVR